MRKYYNEVKKLVSNRVMISKADNGIRIGNYFIYMFLKNVYLREFFFFRFDMILTVHRR